MRKQLLSGILSLCVCVAATLLVVGCKDTPTAPSETPGALSNPASTRAVLDVSRTTADPRAPWAATCPDALRILLSGQVRSAVEPALDAEDSLSGGTGIVRSCDWQIVVGMHNGLPRYPESGTDTTVWANVPGRGDPRFYIQIRSFYGRLTEVNLTDQKALRNPNSLRASREGGHYMVTGTYSTLPVAALAGALSFGAQADNGVSLIAPWFAPMATLAELGRVPQYQGIQLEPGTVLYISPAGEMYRHDLAVNRIQRIR